MTKEMIFQCLFGSHLYGTDTPSSDLDYKAIYKPTIGDIILGKAKETVNTSTNPGPTKNTNQDIDTETFSLRKFMNLLLNGQAVALEMLFVPDDKMIADSPIWRQIKSHKEHWLHKDLRPYVSYCLQQASKYGIKGSRVATSQQVLEFFLAQQAINGPKTRLIEIWSQLEQLSAQLEHASIITEKTRQGVDTLFECCGKKYPQNLSIANAVVYAEKQFNEYGHRALLAKRNEGIDWKALSHAVRVADQAIELLTTHEIKFPLETRKTLWEIKCGEWTFDTVSQLIEQRFDELVDAQSKSSLPETPDWEFMEQFVLHCYGV